jgi:hypothetical protein
MHRFFKTVLSVALIAAFTTVAVGGCATAVKRRKVDVARQDLVGLTRTTLLECAGEPDWSEMVGERETLAYMIGNSESDKHKRATTCIANFQLRRGIVEHLYFETLAGRLVEEREGCLPIVDECLSVVN